MYGYYYIQNFLFLIKSNKDLLRVSWFLFLNKIYEKKPIRIFNLVTFNIKINKKSYSFYIHRNNKLKTNKMCI